MLSRPDLRRTADGDVHKAVWQPACLCIPLLRPHRHQRVSEWFVAPQVYFFRDVLGAPVIEKAVLSKRTEVYRGWVEAYAANHRLPIEWAEKGVREEDYVQPHLRRMVKQNAYGVYFIFKSMEQGSTFRISIPKFPTQDPNHRILARQRSRCTHYYFYVRDKVPGPIVIRMNK